MLKHFPQTQMKVANTSFNLRITGYQPDVSFYQSYGLSKMSFKNSPTKIMEKPHIQMESCRSKFCKSPVTLSNCNCFWYPQNPKWKLTFPTLIFVHAKCSIMLIAILHMFQWSILIQNNIEKSNKITMSALKIPVGQN